MPRTLSTDKYGRIRDTQKSKVYSAENMAGLRKITSKAGKRLLIDEARLIPYSGYGTSNAVLNGKPANASIEDCQRYVDHVVRDSWFQRRWGQRTIVVHWKAGGPATGSFGGGRVALPPWSRNEGVILHEIAHNLTTGNVAAHGPEFVGIMLALVGHFMGAEAAARFRATLKDCRCRKSMAQVPEPTRPVLSLAERRDRKASRQARQASGSSAAEAATWLRLLVVSTRTTTPYFGAAGTKTRARALATARLLDPAGRSARGMDERASVRHVNVVETADTLRAAIKVGTFGPAGSKPRTYALAVAKRLDEIAKGKEAVGLNGRRTYAAKPERW